jgi:hypothetical protein
MKTRLAALAAACFALSACSTMSKMWPFHKKARPGPPAVHELNLVNADGSQATYPQYWVRNTLVVDLSGVGGTGSVAARLPDEATWPVRVAVRVRPGSVDQLEVLGEERNILPVSKDGMKPIDLTLAPSVYTPKTAAIYISWGPMPAFADTAPSTQPDEPGAVPGPRTSPANSVPRLNIVWDCGNCKQNDKVIPLLQQAYRDAAADKGLTISAETAEVRIVDFRQRNPGLRAMLGIMSGKDRLGLKIRFRREVLEVKDFSANAVMGMNHVCETVAKKALKEIRAAR